jgi:hypothetical protein
MITGIGVHDPPEFALTIKRNRCSRSTGFSVHNPPERADPDSRLAKTINSIAAQWDAAKVTAAKLRVAIAQRYDNYHQIANGLSASSSAIRTTPRGY